MRRVPYPLTWILTADGHHARAWVWKNPDAPITLVADFLVSAENMARFSRELKSDRPGRSFASVGLRRSAIEPHSDPHETEKRKFATALAKSLGEALGKDRFRQLIVVAPPHMLGELRAAISEPVRQAVIGEIGKDLMKADVAALYYHAAQFLSVV